MIILTMQSKHVYHVVDHGDAASQDGTLQGQTTETIEITVDMRMCA